MKSNVKHTIKNQLNEREITVSDNAWDRLQEMMDEPQKSAPKSRKLKVWKPLSIAASVVLLIGLFWGLDSQAEKDSPLVASQTKNKEILIKTQDSQNIARIPVQEDLYAETSVSTEQMLTKTETSKVSNSKNTDTNSSIKMEKSEVFSQPEMNQPEITQILPEPSTKLVHQEEVRLEEKKKLNYVDPEMLLYSVENNEAVKQSKSSSRLVLYDFNK
jgi:nitrogen fixation-related uncharacterized protein